jgi:hypothetical protein
VTVHRVAPGEFVVSSPTQLRLTAVLRLPVVGAQPVFAQRVAGALRLVPATFATSKGWTKIRQFGTFTNLQACASSAPGRLRAECYLREGLTQVPRAIAPRLDGPGLVRSSSCDASRPALDLFRWAAVCTGYVSRAQSTSESLNGSLSTDTVSIIHLTDAAPNADESAYVLHVDGTLQQIDSTCVTRLTNRNVPMLNLTTDDISRAPRSTQDGCAPLYGPVETECPSGTSATSAGTPPSTCFGGSRSAKWLTAAAGGQLDFGSYSLAVGPGILARDCYVQIRILSAATRFIENDTDCPFQGVVTVTVPVGNLADTSYSTPDVLSLLHLYDDSSVVPESIRKVGTDRVSAQLKNLSPVLPGRDLVDPDTTCEDAVEATLSVADKLLLGKRLRVWAATECGQYSLAPAAGDAAASRVDAGQYDNITGTSRGYGPKQAAYNCATAAALTRLFENTPEAKEFADKILTSKDKSPGLLLRQVNHEDFVIGEGVGQVHASLADAVADCIQRAQGSSSTDTLHMLIDGHDWTTYEYRVSDQCPCYVQPQPTPAPTQPPIIIQPPQPPQPSVGVSKGASAQGRSGCSSSLCRYVTVSLNNFPGGSHHITIYGGGSAFYDYYNSASSSSVAYYGYHANVFAVVDGVRSNDVAW